MEAIIFTGIQGIGKSSFYKERFFNTHIRINLDMLKTRYREQLLLKACLDAKQPFVVDNTNVTVEGRAKYIVPAKAAGFRVAGYYFRSDVKTALQRNGGRLGVERVPDKAILGTYKRLKVPQLSEGFDVLYYVRMDESNRFVVEAWLDEA